MSNESISKQECKFATSDEVYLQSVMEVESTQSVEIVNNIEGTGSAEIDESAKIDVGEEFVELLTLTTDTMLSEDWCSSLQEPSKIVRMIEENMNKYYQYIENSPNVRPDDSIVLAQIYLQMSTFYHNPHFKKEKLYIGEAYITRCLKLLKDKILDRKAIIIAMSAYFELSCLWWKLENLEKSKQYIYQVLELYNSYTREKDDYPPPICILTIIGQETRRKLIKLDEIYWKALWSISLFLDKRLEEKDRDKNILTYMHKQLKKYLKIVPSIMERVEWTEHAMALARLFLMSDRFVEAKHHIAAAAFIMQQFHDEECMKVDIATSPEKHVVVNEQYVHGISKINVCWAWYGVALLGASGERFRQNNAEAREASDLQSVSRITQTNLQFTDLEKELQKFIVLDKDTYVTNYVDAEAIFQTVLHRLNEVKVYVKKKNNLGLYVDFIRCTSKIYKYLACYEQHKDNLVELHKRRVEALQNIMKSSCATDDGYTHGYISLELAIATSTLLDVQIDNLPMGVEPMSSLEIKDLVNTNIQNFQLYLEHFSHSE